MDIYLAENIITDKEKYMFVFVLFTYSEQILGSDRQRALL